MSRGCLVVDADIRVWFDADIRARWQHAVTPVVGGQCRRMWRWCVVGATSQQPCPRAKAHLPDVALVVQEAEEVLLDVADEVADNAGSGTGGVRIRCRLRTTRPNCSPRRRWIVDHPWRETIHSRCTSSKRSGGIRTAVPGCTRSCMYRA